GHVPGRLAVGTDVMPVKETRPGVPKRLTAGLPVCEHFVGGNSLPHRAAVPSRESLGLNLAPPLGAAPRARVDAESPVGGRGSQQLSLRLAGLARNAVNPPAPAQKRRDDLPNVGAPVPGRRPPRPGAVRTPMNVALQGPTDDGAPLLPVHQRAAHGALVA